MKVFNTADNQKTVEFLVEQFKKLPDASRFPLPAVLYEKYGIEKPNHNNDDLNFAVGNAVARMSAGGVAVELRGPLPGGVREIQLPEKLETQIEIIPKDIQEDNELNRDYSIYTKSFDATNSIIQQILRD
jgi:hypothetical protein